MSVHTFHFGRRKVGTKPAGSLNAIQVYADALRDTELARERLRNLLNSTNRHGDLQVALSAAERLRGRIQLLIDAEERA